MKLNCDASKMGYEDDIGFGCVIRDCHDCHEAFILLQEYSVLPSNDTSDLIRRIKELLHRQWRVEIHLIQRTANKIADAVAKHALAKRITHADWPVPWDGLRDLLQQDLE
ncbi:hypothetical protein PIB30_061013 [Stylosanthes scabra]|uniref:RNase H type-1 domain-containing protein n=1 Tax=Stylosanthes scabra TaxID=79078 RepID=A0ABU6SKU6_9FABA|nr:hypothetical protein [Stylosanthes scabra]